jgi:hypothetical protein
VILELASGGCAAARRRGKIDNSTRVVRCAICFLCNRGAGTRRDYPDADSGSPVCPFQAVLAKQHTAAERMGQKFGAVGVRPKAT